MKEKGEIVEKMSNFSRKAGRVVFSEPFWGALEPLDRFWTTFWSLWGILVTKSLPKVARRLPKGSQEGVPHPPPFYAISGKLGSVVFYENVKKRYLVFLRTEMSLKYSACHAFSVVGQ